MKDLKDYVDEKVVLKQLKEEEFEKSFYTVKFSVNVDEILNRRLKHVASELDVPRAELVRDLITFVLADLEAHLGLDHLDLDSPYGQAIYSGIESIPLRSADDKVFMSVTKDQFKTMIAEGRGEK